MLYEFLFYEIDKVVLIVFNFYVIFFWINGVFGLGRRFEGEDLEWFEEREIVWIVIY